MISKLLSTLPIIVFHIQMKHVETFLPLQRDGVMTKIFPFISFENYLVIFFTIQLGVICSTPLTFNLEMIDIYTQIEVPCFSNANNGYFILFLPITLYHTRCIIASIIATGLYHLLHYNFN